MPESEGVGDRRVGVKDTEICRLPEATKDQVLVRGEDKWEAGDCPGPDWGTLATGTLNDANPDDEITTTENGALCWIGISLENLENTDDFDIELSRWDGAAWLLYKKYSITKAAGAISIDIGGGAVVQNLEELNLENIYLDSTRKLRLKVTRNSGTDRDFKYWYNKQE